MDQRTAFDIVKNYIRFLKNNKYNVQKAFVFGSYANGQFNDESVIDLAIVFKNLSNGFLMQIELIKISHKFDNRIEPHPFDESDFNMSNPFANEIISKGIQIV